MYIYTKTPVAEYAALSSGRPAAANSRLLQLAPLFDTEDGLIHVGGRCKSADDMAEDCKHPVILSRNNHVTTLLIKSFDEKLLHPGRERLLAELRRKFRILQGRAAVRKVQGSCMDCRRFRGKPQPPRMADLPPCRLRLFKPPFYSTGADCFGPILVTVGRQNEKRCGIIFTCLTVRAIHLELLESLDTDAFLMAFRRFTPRRGTPRELWLDQGTNFVGGRNEIADALSKMEPQVAKQLADKGTAFKFITPSAPTHGGAWEREVKSVKAALYAGLKDHRVSESVLRTLFVEVEGVLNSKPLTYVSTDAQDPAADAADWPCRPFPATRHLPRRRDVDETTLAAEPGLGRPVLETIHPGVLADNPVPSKVAAGGESPSHWRRRVDHRQPTHSSAVAHGYDRAGVPRR